MKFSETALRKLEVQDKKKYYGDQEQKYFFVRVLPTKTSKNGKKVPGKKSYVVRFRPEGHRGSLSEKTVGEVGKISLANARKRAHMMLGEIGSESGHDLVLAMDEYLRWLGERKKHKFDWNSVKKSSDPDSVWASLLNGDHPLSRAPSDISAKYYVYRQFYTFMRNRMGGRNPTLEVVKPAHIREFLLVPSSKFRGQVDNADTIPSADTKRRRLSAISTLFEYFSNRRESFPLSDLENPASGVSVPTPNWSPKSLKAEHLKLLVAALSQKPDRQKLKPNQTSDRTLWVYHCFLRCRLLMGTRTNALILADWEEKRGQRTNYFSKDMKTLICWSHKNGWRTGQPEYIPVPSGARSILRQLKDEGYVSPDPENNAVFFDDRRRECAPEFQGRISARRANSVFKHICDDIEDRSSEDIRQGMTQRNLRHSFVTEMFRLGVRHDQISRAVGHKDMNTIKYYHQVSEAEIAALADSLPDI